MVGWPVTLLPRLGTHRSRWVSQFLRWVRSAPFAPCVLGFRHPLVSAGTIRPDGCSRWVAPSTRVSRAGAPRDLSGAFRGECPGSPSLGLTGNVPSLLRPPPRSPSPWARPWKRCLFWSASAKLLPLLTVKNMGPGEETGSETDGGRGGAAGSPRCRSPRGGGERAGRPRFPSGLRSLVCHRPVRAEVTAAGSAPATRPHLTLARAVFLSLHGETCLFKREELWN